MNNTEILKELDTLKTELNGRIDSFKQKYEDSIKPKIEKGWLKLIGYDVFCYTTDLRKGYGVSHDYTWTDQMFIDDLSCWQQATQKEVKEALTKEAVKRGFKEGVKYKNKYGSTGIIVEKCFCLDGNDLGQRNNMSGCNFHYIMENGTWAQIISEPKTIDEWANEYANYVIIGKEIDSETRFKNFITKNNFKLPD